MNTINDKFSFRRLCSVMKRDITADGMLYLWIFLGMLAFMTYFQLSHFSSNNHLAYLEHYGVDRAVKNLHFEMFSHSLMVLLTYICLTTMTLCNPTRKKKGAINYLMMPATCAEKFVSRILVAVIATLILTLLVWLLSDLLRMGIIAAFPRYADVPAECNVFTIGHTLWALGNVFSKRSFGGPDQTLYPLVCNYAMVMFYLYSHSLMSLGACVFRNVVASLFPFFALVYVVFLTGDGLTNLMAHHPVPTLLVFTILTVFNWWLSYYYFSHKMVVRRPGYIIRRKEATV